jgi:hypothetical protein
MASVTVFCYEQHDIHSERFVRSTRPATRHVIAMLGGRVVAGSALVVDASRIDRKGYLMASHASRMSTPEQRALMLQIEASARTAQDISAYERALIKQLICPKCWPNGQPLMTLNQDRLVCPSASCRAVYVVVAHNGHEGFRVPQIG